MDWDAPIGLGKMGNNPYAMAGLGAGLMGMGPSQGGLVGMLRGMGGTDPATIQKFIAASEAQDAPVSSIPREGLLPQLLSKIGILSPNINASPSTMNLETLALRQQQSERMGAMLDAWGKLADIANKGGTTFAGQAYSAIPGMSQMFPGFDPSKVQTPEERKAGFEAQEIKLREAAEKQRDEQIAILSRRADQGDILAQAAMIRASADEMRAENTANKELKSKSDAGYRTIIGQLGSDERGMVGGQADVLKYARNWFMQQYAHGVPVDEAYIQALNDPKIAPALEMGPPSMGPQSSNTVGGYLRGLFGGLGIGPGAAYGGSDAPSAAPNAAATPSTVREPKSFTK